MYLVLHSERPGQGASEGTNLEEPIEPDALGGSDEPKDGVELQHF